MLDASTSVFTHLFAAFSGVFTGAIVAVWALLGARRHERAVRRLGADAERAARARAAEIARRFS